MNFKEIETPWPRERETPKPRERVHCTEMLGGEIEIERGNSRKHNLKHSIKEKKSGRSFLITNLIHNFLALQMSTNFFYPISESLMNFLTILL